MEAGLLGHGSWFAVDGALAPVDFPGPSHFRFPEPVAEHVIERFSGSGDWVLDPFCGFGTTLAVAERLGRHGAGIEIDPERAAFAASRLSDPARVASAPCEAVPASRWPPCALLFTSPPYGNFRGGFDDDDPAVYAADAGRLFGGLRRFLAPGATVAVEVSQVRRLDRTRPLVWELGMALSEMFVLREDIVRVNTGPHLAGPGYGHSHVLVFSAGG